MDKHGKVKDVIVEEGTYSDPLTGIEKSLGYLIVWADAGLKDVIASVKGVNWVTTDLRGNTCYHAYVDERYNFEFVGREIEAAIKCRGEA